MPKPITFEMIEAMSTDQRKILHENAMKRDTVASRDVLELLAQIVPKSAPAAKAKAPAKKAAPKKKAAAKVEQDESAGAPWDE